MFERWQFPLGLKILFSPKKVFAVRHKNGIRIWPQLSKLTLKNSNWSIQRAGAKSQSQSSLQFSWCFNEVLRRLQNWVNRCNVEVHLRYQDGRGDSALKPQELATFPGEENIFLWFWSYKSSINHWISSALILLSGSEQLS